MLSRTRTNSDKSDGVSERTFDGGRLPAREVLQRHLEILREPDGHFEIRLPLTMYVVAQTLLRDSEFL